MKEYYVYFSGYSKLSGMFEEIGIKVGAKDQFSALSTAWSESINNGEFNLYSCIQLCGIWWTATPLDLQDYFNASAEYEKYRINYLKNIEVPNASIGYTTGSEKYHDAQISEHYWSLYTIQQIAKDLGKPHGMLPPAIYTELHYATSFVDIFDQQGDYPKAQALMDKITGAQNWDISSMHFINCLFREEYTHLLGEYTNLTKHFSKDGIFPRHADTEDNQYKYVHRWAHARKYPTVSSLPFFDENSVIVNSHTIQYDWQTLILKKEALKPENQIPINSLWTPRSGGEANSDVGGDRLIEVENLITGEIAHWARSSFLGILRPEISANIDYIAIKKELAEAKL